MSQSHREAGRSWSARFREGFGRRATAIGLAVLAEVLLVLVFLTLNPSLYRSEESVEMTTFDVAPTPDPAPVPEESRDSAETETEAEPPPEPPEPEPQPQPPQPIAPETPLPPVMIELPREQMAAADITPAPPSRPVMGPPATGRSDDTPRVGGSGPNGEPLYAAAWYREPYAEELRGYLSTARGPGWGLIACRTVPNFRVEDCIQLDEYPEGSNIARAVLAAAWQFRVRPPRLGGEAQVGEWVRIRIDYNLRRQ